MSEKEEKVDYAGCAMCSTASTGYCFCQVIFANIIGSKGVNFGDEIEFEITAFEQNQPSQ